MQLVMLLMGLVVVVVILVLVQTLRAPQPTPVVVTSPQYCKVETVLTPAERQFYEVLRQAVGTRYVIFAKMRVLDLVDVVVVIRIASRLRHLRLRMTTTR